MTVNKVAHSGFILISLLFIISTYQTNKSMSTLHHEDMLLQIFDEVQEAFPYLDEEKQIEIANNKFQELCQ